MELFDQLKGGDETGLEELCTRKAEEGLHLEFKSKGDPSTTGLEKTDRKNWGKCLSGFSNADGGVVIWGIKTGKGAEREFADAPDPIKDPAIFAAHLRQLAV